MVGIESFTDKSKNKVMVNENGVTYIRIYDTELKMHMNIYSNPNNHHGGEDIKKALKEIYLQQFDRC